MHTLGYQHRHSGAVMSVISVRGVCEQYTLRVLFVSRGTPLLSYQDSPTIHSCAVLYYPYRVFWTLDCS